MPIDDQHVSPRLALASLAQWAVDRPLTYDERLRFLDLLAQLHTELRTITHRLAHQAVTRKDPSHNA